MGTRADFYLGRGSAAEWLGSIAWDGYPDGIPDAVLGSASEPEYRQAVASMLSERDDGTEPGRGWPWPWEDSGTTDYAYAFDGSKVWASGFGSPWWPAAEPEPGEELPGPGAVFPNMSNRSAVTTGPRSGVMVFGGGSPGPDKGVEDQEVGQRKSIADAAVELRWVSPPPSMAIGTPVRTTFEGGPPMWIAGETTFVDGHPQVMCRWWVGVALLSDFFHLVELEGVEVDAVEGGAS